MVNVTQSWLYVKCLRGFDGGLPQEFICEVSQEWNDKVISNITSKTQPEFRLTGLEARTSYRIVIYATNVKGRSKESVLLNISTLPNVTSQSRRIVGEYQYKNVMIILILFIYNCSHHVALKKILRKICFIMFSKMKH